jgi:hypothetical protein
MTKKLLSQYYIFTLSLFIFIAGFFSVKTFAATQVAVNPKPTQDVSVFAPLIASPGADAVKPSVTGEVKGTTTVTATTKTAADTSVAGKISGKLWLIIFCTVLLFAVLAFLTWRHLAGEIKQSKLDNLHNLQNNPNNTTIAQPDNTNPPASPLNPTSI